MSEPSVYTHCSGRNFGCQGYGTGAKSGDGEVHPLGGEGKAGMIVIFESGWEEVLPPPPLREFVSVGE